MSGQQPVLSAQGLGKCYQLYDSPSARLRELVLGGQRHSLHWALRGVGFELHRGQCLGVVGDNGAGKSTLLKLIAGTLQPSTGSLQRVGRVTAILELGAGFHPDFSGRENLYFSGAIIGIPAEQMRELETSIIDFAELHEAIDRPVKTYSSGMVVRLAFALVTAVEPDILIVDEALAVGDQHFQKKCSQRIERFRDNGCAILFCSHSLYHVRKLCDQAIWLHRGEVQAMGEVEPVLARYESYVRMLDAPTEQPTSSATGTSRGRAGLLSVEVAGLQERAGEPARLSCADLCVTVTAYADDGVAPNMAVMLERADGVGITAVGTHADGFTPRQLDDGSWQATVCFTDLPLYSGEYDVSAYLFDREGVLVLDEWLRYRRFAVVYATLETGLVRLPHVWR